jgi:hypothetical protein
MDSTDKQSTPPPLVGLGTGKKIPTGGQLVTPPVMLALAQKRKVNQLALRAANKEAQAKETRRAEEMKKKLEEEQKAAKAAEAEKATEAAQHAVAEKELLDLMDMDDDVSAGLEGLVRDLEKETDTASKSPLKKRSRNKETSSKTSHAQAVLHTLTLRQSSFIPHSYRNPRVIVEGSARLSSDDKAAQFLGLVDPFFILNPTTTGGGKKDLRDVKDVPANMTALWSYVKILEKSIQTFLPRSGHTGGSRKEGGGNYSQYVDQVYFTMVWSCDIDPKEIIAGITVEWMRAGGIGLYRKEIQAIDTFSPFVILKLCIYVGVHTLVADFKRLLEEVLRMMEEEAMADGESLVLALPPFAFQKSPPKLPGLDPAEYAGLHSKHNAARNAWHVEMEKQHVHLFQRLIEKAKDFNMFEDLWGRHVLISEVVDFTSLQGDIEHLMKEAKKHTCFQVSMTCKQLTGVLDIDAEVAFKVDDEGKAVGGMVSLRSFLPARLCTRDNKLPLIAEMHQRQQAAPVKVVIPNTEEADSMIGDVNRNTPAFLKFYLMGIGFEEDFVIRLIKASCCPIMLGKMTGITWNKEKVQLVLPEDLKEKESLEAFENQEWFFNLKSLRVSPRKRGDKNYTAPEALFNLDADKLVVTLHTKNDARRAAAYNLSDSDSGKEESDSASGKRDSVKSPNGKATDKEDGETQESISWEDPTSGPSDGNLSPHAAAGGG